MKQHNMDERQLWLRGDVFKHSLLFMGFLILLRLAFTNNGITPLDVEWSDIFIVSLTASFGSIEMSLKGVYDFDNKRMMLFTLIMGVCGFIILLLNIIGLINGESIISDSQLTKTGAYLITSLTFLAVPITYFIMRSHYHKKLSD